MAGATARVSFSSLETQDVKRLTLGANVPPDIKEANNTESKRLQQYKAHVTR